MKKRLLGSLLAAMLVLGILAPAASADTIGSGVFGPGTADVGKFFAANDPCDKSGLASVQGEGLYLPGTPEDMARRGEGVWQLSSTFTFVGQSQFGSGVSSGTFNVCGRLESMVENEAVPAAEIGASCGPSKGFEGKGLATSDLVHVKLYNVGWKAVAGNVIPVVGNYQDLQDDDATKKNKHGNLLALVNVAPADENETLACTGLEGNGAKHFAVAGTFSLYQPFSDKGKYDTWKDCKADGPKDKNAKPGYTDCKGPGPQK